MCSGLAKRDVGLYRGWLFCRHHKKSMKVIVTKLVRIEGQYDNDGNPVYIVKSGNMVVASAPEHLRDPKGGKDNG